MPQHDLKTLDPLTDDGTLLASELNAWKPAVHSQHQGDTRPAYATKGMLWVDTSADPEIVLWLYTGTIDKEIARITTSGQVLAGEQAVIWSVDVPGHTFQPGNVARFNGTTWVKAIATSAATAGHALVRAVTATKVTFQSAGLYHSPINLGLVPGTLYYLSATTAGLLEPVRPTTGVAQPIMVATEVSGGVMTVGTPVTVTGFIKTVPTAQGDNYIIPSDGTFVPLSIMQRNPQTAPLLGFIDAANTRYIGYIDANGYPQGTLAPAVQVPVGAMMWWPAVNPPAGYLDMHGQAIPAIYPILRSIYGPNLPDWSGRVAVNYSAGLPIATGGGSYAALLSMAHLPVRQFLSGASMVTGAGDPKFPSAGDGTHHLVTSGGPGGGQVVPTMPPYVALNLIVKHD